MGIHFVELLNEI